MRRGARLVILCAGLLAAGCGFAQKPYANAPLLRGGRAVWASGDAAPRPPAPAVEPPQPHPTPPATSRAE